MDILSAETQRLEGIYQQKLAALKKLKQSILQKAFTGELTVDNEQLTAQIIDSEQLAVNSKLLKAG
ncbi:MAG TPA: hypothetical protein V6D03_01580 [Candidatus Caenarcaniphilales bacterium]